MRINNEGSVVQFIPESDEETDWLNEEVLADDFQWLGKTLVVDYRMAQDLFQAVRDAGFAVKD